MKTQLLKSIFLLGLLRSVFCISSNPQIVYTNIPDVTISSSSTTYNLDMNDDGITDFQFSFTTKSGCWGGNYYVDITPQTGNDVLNTLGKTSYPTALSLNSLIDLQSQTWENSDSQTLSDFVWSCMHGNNQHNHGNFKDGSDKYLGVKFQVNNKVYLGWIRINGTKTPSVTIKDFGYNSITDSPILAGQTCPPQAVIVANGSTTFCAGDSVVISSANTGTNLSYEWKLNGTNISGATNKSYTAKTAGKYRVKVTDNTNDCDTTSAIVKVKVSCKSLNNLSTADDESIMSYPNPFSSSTLITFNLASDENVSLKIYDVEGRLTRMLSNDVMRAGVQKLIWDGRDENGNGVNAGIYLLRMQTANESETIQLSLIKWIFL